jgi:hypothetical protein
MVPDPYVPSGPGGETFDEWKKRQEANGHAVNADGTFKSGNALRESLNNSFTNLREVVKECKNTPQPCLTLALGAFSALELQAAQSQAARAALKGATRRDTAGQTYLIFVSRADKEAILAVLK